MSGGTFGRADKKLFFQQDPSGCAGRGDRPVRSKRKAHGVSFAKDRGADRDLKDDESDVTFAQIMEDILERVGTYMHLSNGSLLKLQVDEEHVEMICEWADKPEHERMRTYGSLPLAEVPFMTGRPDTRSRQRRLCQSHF